MLINITGGPDLALHEVNEAATLIQEEADDEANIIFGAVIDEHHGRPDPHHRDRDRLRQSDRVREPIRPVERETERPDARRPGVVRELPKEGGRRVVDSA